MNDLTKEDLVLAIRSAESLSELTRLIGPTEEENEQSRMRLERIDELDKRCDWENCSPGIDAIEARAKRRAVMDQQAEFENKYC